MRVAEAAGRLTQLSEAMVAGNMPQVYVSGAGMPKKKDEQHTDLNGPEAMGWLNALFDVRILPVFNGTAAHAVLQEGKAKLSAAVSMLWSGCNWAGSNEQGLTIRSGGAIS